MKTDDWIGLLATQAGPAPRWAVQRRLLPALALGSALALGLATGWPWAPWQTGTDGAVLALKLGYTAAVLLAATSLAIQLGRPVMRQRHGLVWLLLTVLGMLLAAWATQVPGAPAGGAGVQGQGSASVCAVSILGLSLPTLAAGFWALRGLAPTRPALAGGALGLMAGGAGALAYAVVCTESSALFVAVWYSVAMGLPALLGALLGPRLLRW